jgi:hypothetical protein
MDHGGDAPADISDSELATIIERQRRSAGVRLNERQPEACLPATAIRAISQAGCFRDRRQDREWWKKHILMTVHDPALHDSIAGRAAHLVVYDGVPAADIEHVLGELEELRGAGKLRSPGAFFLTKIRKLAASKGKQFNRQKQNNERPG